MRSEQVFYYLIGLLTGLIFFVFPITGWDFSYFAGDLADGRLNLYFLEHNYQFFTGQIDTYWDIPSMYPEKNVLAYSDNLMGSSPIYSLFRLFGINTFHSYVSWFIAICILNYSSAFFALKKIFKNNQAALLGAFTFAFSIAIQSQLTHAQTFPRFAIPLAFLMAYQFSESMQPKYFLFCLLFLVYQIYCGIYLGFLLAIPIAIYLILILIKDFSGARLFRQNKWWFLKIPGILIGGLLSLLPIMRPYLERKKAPSAEHFEQIFESVPTISSHFLPASNSSFWSFLSPLGNQIKNSYDHEIFVGFIGILACIIAIVLVFINWRKKSYRFFQLSGKSLLVITGGITFLLFLRIGDYSLYKFIYYIPGFSSMRSMTRIVNIQLFFVAVSVAYVYTQLLTNRVKLGRIVLPVLLTLFLLDNSFNSQKISRRLISQSTERTELLDKVMDQIPVGSAVSFEPETSETLIIYSHMDALLMAQKHKLKTINAYTATCPGDYISFWEEPNSDSRNYWLAGQSVTDSILYVIDKHGNVTKENMREIAGKMTRFEKRVQERANYIRTDKAWFDAIKKDAIEQGIPIDSALYSNAKYVVEMEDLENAK